MFHRPPTSVLKQRRALLGRPVRAFAMAAVMLWFGCVLACADWNLVWSDEFNGTSLNTNVWWCDLGPGTCINGNSELEIYTNDPSTVFESNGMLHIVAQNIGTGSNYLITSARVMSYNIDDCSGVITSNTPFTFCYGAIEFRAKLPSGLGLWPALWLLPAESYVGGTNGEDPIYGPWPGSGEVDIMENNGINTNNVSFNLIYLNGNSQSSGTVNDTTQWHIYRLQWTTNEFDYMVDGVTDQTVTTWNAPAGYFYPAPFDTPFYIIMNLAVGGNYTGYPSAAAVAASLPAEMDIDYVRVYKQTTPLVITTAQTNGAVVLTWPTNIVCHLQSLNDLSNLGGNSSWFDVPNTNNPFVVSPVSNPASFYRLISP